jgi:hypothetical protein
MGRDAFSDALVAELDQGSRPLSRRVIEQAYIYSLDFFDGKRMDQKPAGKPALVNGTMKSAF